jgi:hypothetical protein
VQFGDELLAGHPATHSGEIAEDDVVSMHRWAPLIVIFIGSGARRRRHGNTDTIGANIIHAHINA